MRGSRNSRKKRESENHAFSNCTSSSSSCIIVCTSTPRHVYTTAGKIVEILKHCTQIPPASLAWLFLQPFIRWTPLPLAATNRWDPLNLFLHPQILALPYLDGRKEIPERSALDHHSSRDDIGIVTLSVIDTAIRAAQHEPETT